MMNPPSVSRTIGLLTCDDMQVDLTAHRTCSARPMCSSREVRRTSFASSGSVLSGT